MASLCSRRKRGRGRGARTRENNGVLENCSWREEKGAHSTIYYISHNYDILQLPFRKLMPSFTLTFSREDLGGNLTAIYKAGNENLCNGR